MKASYLLFKNYFLLLTSIAFLTLFNANAQSGFVIDHTTTDLAAIPDAWVSQAKADLHIDYNHTSHGSQLISGMNALNDFPDFGTTYAWADTSYGDDSHLSLDDHWGSDLSTGDADSDGDGIANWAETTYAFLDNTDNYHINVIMWSWCNIGGHNIPRYLNSMEWLIEQFDEGGTHARATDYPVKFVFITGHANGGGEGDSSDTPNEIIRAHVAENNRILFDFSDIENYDPDNNYYLDKRVDDALYYDNTPPYDSGTRDANWASEYLVNHDDSELDRLTTGNGVEDYDGCNSCAHSDGPDNEARLNCILKGRAAWHLFARLAGWDGTYIGLNENITTQAELFQNTPNPFDTSTVISYKLQKTEHVTLCIYDLLGNKINTLVNENKNAGLHQVSFMAESLSGGIYYYSIRVGEKHLTKKMLLLH